MKRFHENQSQFRWWLPLNKLLKLYNLTVVVRFVFEEDGKHYPQVFLDEPFYEL